MKFILASQSQRRKDILANAGYNFEIIPSNYDEKLCNQAYSDEIVINCAYYKAKDIINRTNKNNIIIASDTVVVLNNKILGKPKDEKEAFYMLKNLSDKTHFVATSICLIKGEKIIKDIDKTYVTFRKLTEDEIYNYIKNKKPLDKAGSYGIQDDGFDFAIKVDGSIENVIGFPINLFKEMIKNI